eukprot:5594778-Pleurochrysis_carterae.AAC.2
MRARLQVTPPPQRRLFACSEPTTVRAWAFRPSQLHASWNHFHARGSNASASGSTPFPNNAGFPDQLTVPSAQAGCTRVVHSWIIAVNFACQVVCSSRLRRSRCRRTARPHLRECTTATTMASKEGCTGELAHACHRSPSLMSPLSHGPDSTRCFSPVRNVDLEPWPASR